MSNQKDSKSVSLVKCRDYDPSLVFSAMEKLISHLGKPEDFFPSQSKILLKPNLLGGHPPKNAVTTHPVIVETLARMALDCGCKVSIGDSPAIHSTQKAARECGILDVCNKLGIPLADFSEKVEVSTETGSLYRKIPIAKPVLECDHIINIPKFKTHGQMGMTLSVKNTYGYIPGTLKAAGHLKAGKNADLFARFICDVHNIKKPLINIIDGVWGMEGNGPGSGTPRHLGFIGGSTCGFSLDTICSQIAGINPLSLPVLCVNPINPENILLSGDSLSNFIKKDFKPARKSDIRFQLPGFLLPFLDFLVLPFPLFSSEKCQECRLCEIHCPAKAVTIVDSKHIQLKKEKCIRCFICQEICPHKAISVKESLWYEIKNFFNK